MQKQTLASKPESAQDPSTLVLATANANADSRPSVWSTVRNRLPLGERLPTASFAARHAVATTVAALLFASVFVIGGANGEDLYHLLAEQTPLAIALLVGYFTTSRLVASFSICFALMAASSLLVHYTDGLIEAHFLFFVLLPLVALYQDWRVFIGSVVYVVGNHAIVGTLNPEEVYNHPAAQAKPVLWGLIHGMFVFGLIVVLIVEWNFAEADRRRANRNQGELLKAREDLHQAQKLESVGQLAAGIAHEINTPMQYIGDNIHFLKASLTRLIAVAQAAETAVAEGATETDRADLVAAIENAKLPMISGRAPKAAGDAIAGVENVSRIVRAMKRFSHPWGDEPEAVDINAALETTVLVCRNEWKYHAKVVTDLASDVPVIDGHLGPLNQVWLNMIVNAAHAIADNHDTGEMGTIMITTRATLEGGAQITIEDDGAGIAPENLNRVFDHFFTTKEVGKGTGQGLSIAHQVIVAEHGGQLTVDSVLGEGSTFTITLPRDQKQKPQGACP